MSSTNDRRLHQYRPLIRTPPRSHRWDMWHAAISLSLSLSLSNNSFADGAAFRGREERHHGFGVELQHLDRRVLEVDEAALVAASGGTMVLV